jgi:hypothetical protein
MDESEYLRQRAQSCYQMARSTKLSNVIRQLEAQAVEFDRRAAALEARRATLR